MGYEIVLHPSEHNQDDGWVMLQGQLDGKELGGATARLLNSPGTYGLYHSDTPGHFLIAKLWAVDKIPLATWSDAQEVVPVMSVEEARAKRDAIISRFTRPRMFSHG